jgi:sugar phosphate isomerase/epimerase
MGLALSLSWDAFQNRPCSEMLFEIRQMGFLDVELSFNLSAARLQEIEKGLKSSGMRAVSVHNYCPVPDGLRPEQALPDCYSLASLEEEERSLALRFTRNTMDTAVRLGAKAVVLHCARVEVPDRTRELIALASAGKKDSQEYKQIMDDALTQRAQRVKPFFERILKSLDELNSYAQRKGLFLGVETRFYWREIPILDEVGVILEKFKGSRVLYWHDTGHAEVMERLGFSSHKRFLELYADRLLGVHLHDVTGFTDHLPPGRGEMDFSWMRPFLTANTLKVIEAHQPATATQVRESREYLEKVFHGTT